MIIKENLKTKIASSRDIYNIMNPIFNTRPDEDKHKEYFYTIGLDSQNRILYVDLGAIGTINQCSPVTREILRMAIIKNAVSIILVHNHPSGNTIPSTQDRSFTQEVNRACDIMRVKLLDHIIVGDDYYSFLDKGEV